MKEFNLFLDAISHHEKCVLCSHNMSINSRDLAEDHGSLFRKKHAKISFFISENNDIVSIDPDTNEVSVCLTNSKFGNYHNGFYGPISSYTSVPNSVSSGTSYHALTIECKKCCQFSFTLQVIIDLSAKILTGIFLNAEYFTLEDADIIHEVKNNYSLKQTFYTCLLKDGSSKSITLPLIDFNFSNLKETITRIRNLIIFT